jgi:hypothetical protein
MEAGLQDFLKLAEADLDAGLVWIKDYPKSQ